MPVDGAGELVSMQMKTNNEGPEAPAPKATSATRATMANRGIKDPDGDTERPHRRGWRSIDVARAAVIALAVWFGFRLLGAVSSLAFLVFLATLFGLAIATGVDWLEKFGIRRGVGSALIMLSVLGLIGAGLAWTAPTLVTQSRELQRDFPEAIHKLRTWLDSKQLGLFDIGAAATPSPSVDPASIAPATAPDSAPNTTTVSPWQVSAPAVAAVASSTDVIRQHLSESAAGISKYLFSFVSGTLAVITAFILMVFLAMYIGAEPEVYHGWILAVVPARSRPVARVLLARVAAVLRKWLVTQLIAMIVIGTVSMIVLLVLGVRAPFALAFIAGLMEFVPTVGPILSAVPAVLMAFVDSPGLALAVVIAYWGIQFLENNLLIPFLMRGEMDLPPAITLIAQTLMTLLFGFIGLMVAVPLTAAVLVPVRMMAEREDALEQAATGVVRTEPDGSSEAPRQSDSQESSSKQ